MMEHRRPQTYNPTVAENMQLRAQNEALQARVQELEDLLDQGMIHIQGSLL